MVCVCGVCVWYVCVCVGLGEINTQHNHKHGRDWLNIPTSLSIILLHKRIVQSVLVHFLIHLLGPTIQHFGSLYLVYA